MDITLILYIILLYMINKWKLCSVVGRRMRRRLNEHKLNFIKEKFQLMGRQGLRLSEDAELEAEVLKGVLDETEGKQSVEEAR